MRNPDQVMTILNGSLDGIRGRRPVVESQICHMMPLLEFAQHVICADLPAGIDRMQQVGLEPEQSHTLRRSQISDFKWLAESRSSGVASRIAHLGSQRFRNLRFEI